MSSEDRLAALVSGVEGRMNTAKLRPESTGEIPGSTAHGEESAGVFPWLAL